MSHQPVKATDVEAVPVEFLWGNRFPVGKISVVAGRPDQGKGLLAARVAADVSQHSKVLYSAAEDDDGSMTRPRLEVAGAKLENVLLWRFALPVNFEQLAQIIAQHEIRLVVLDPFASHLSNGVSRHSDNVRNVLGPLTDIIERHDCTVLIIEHALKRAQKAGHPLDVIGGTSSGLPAASRACFIFGQDPMNTDRRVLAPAKFNIGPWPKAMSFELDVDELPVVGEMPFLEFDTELEVFDAMELVTTSKDQAVKNAVGRPPEKRAQAAEWLATYLAQYGATLSSTIQEDAKQVNMSIKTLRRAADDMDVVKDPPTGKLCRWDLNDEMKDLMGVKSEPVAGATEAPVSADQVQTSLSDADLNALLGGDQS